MRDSRRGDLQTMVTQSLQMPTSAPGKDRRHAADEAWWNLSVLSSSKMVKNKNEEGTKLKGKGRKEGEPPAGGSEEE